MPPPLTIVPDPQRITRRITRGLLLAASLVFVAHVLTRLSWRIRLATPFHFREFFNMGSEYSVNTWLTVVLAFTLGAGCIALGAVRRERSWYLLGAIFTYLSLDDATMLHENVGRTADRMGMRAGAYSWLIVFGPALAILALIVFRGLWRAFAADSVARTRILLAFVAVGCAVAIEFAERSLSQAPIRIRGMSPVAYTVPVEEFCELVAPILLLACVAGLLEETVRARVAASTVSVLESSPDQRRVG